MVDGKWRELDEEGIERLLVERWLLRGMVLGVVLVAAVAVTYLGIRGVTGGAERLIVAALLALGLAAACVAFAMRQHDLRLYRELRRRHGPGDPESGNRPERRPSE